MKHRLLAFALVCANLCSGTSLATDAALPQMGRLFTAPESRNALDRQRQLNIQETRTLEGDSMRLDGVVVRSSGKSTIWVNNRPQSGNVSDTGVSAAVTQKQPERATLTAGAETPAELKVGVTLNRGTRETSGGLADGEVRVRRPATQK